MKINFRKFVGSFVIVLMVGSSFISGGSVQAQREERKSPEPEYVAGQLIVKFKDTREPSTDFRKKYAIDSAKKLTKQSLYVLTTKQDLKKLIPLVSQNPSVEYAEPNYILHVQGFPNDPKFPQQWSLNNTGISGADIDAPEAWDATHDSDVAVGIIDTGIDYTHPDLVENIWKNPGEIVGNGIDDDDNGYVDDVYGWDFVNEDNNPYDDHGHGTHVAGIIGASGNNGIGITGIAWNVKVAALKFLNFNGTGTTEDAIEAIQYANVTGFKITNNSWGGSVFSQSLYDAIYGTHVQGNLFIAAAGNQGANMDLTPAYPGAYDLPNIISVASTDSNDGKASNSNYGQTSVDLGAPGVGIYSTVPIPGCVLCDPTGYKVLNGTSMAAPHVSGFAALLWSRDSGASNLEIKNFILSTTDPINSLEGKTVTGGRLNIYNIFDAADVTAPASVQDFSVQGTTKNLATLKFTAVGDDVTQGQAKTYDIRYSATPLNDENFDSATKITNEPKPAISGTPETIIVSGLNPDTLYYFSIRVADNVRNVSGLSNVSVRTQPVSVLFKDDMEGEITWINTGNSYPLLWHKSYRRSSSPSRAWYYGKDSDGTYDTGYANYGVITSPIIDLRGIVGSELRFKHFLSTENVPSYDIARVQIMNADGSNLTTLLTKNTTSAAWMQELLDISSYDGKEVKIKFYFDTVDSVNNRFEGWYVDDVEVSGTESNKKPIADAGTDVTAQAYQNILFDGSLSSDPDGSIVSYVWDFGDGTTVIGSKVNHAFTSPGTYTATLTVTDNGGRTATDSVIATISSVSPIVVFSDGFEVSEWNGLWSEDIQNDWSRTSTRRSSGTYSAQVKGDTSGAQLSSVPIDLQGRARATITFSWFNDNSLDTGEYIAFDVSTDGGTSWAEKAILRGNVDNENLWIKKSIDVINISQLRLRYRGRMNQSNESAYLDEVRVTAW
jgi:subtilisin family serine protease/PKD repeat protein